MTCTEFHSTFIELLRQNDSSVVFCGRPFVPSHRKLGEHEQYTRYRSFHANFYLLIIEIKKNYKQISQFKYGTTNNKSIRTRSKGKRGTTWTFTCDFKTKNGTNAIGYLDKKPGILLYFGHYKV